MGFLIFAFRKLGLKREINQKQFRQMQLSVERQRIDAQKNAMEQTKSIMQDSWNMVFNNMSDTSQSIFKTNADVAHNKAIQANDEYNKMVSSNPGNEQVRQEYENKRNQAQADENAQNKLYMASYQAAQTGFVAANQAVNNVFAAANKAQLNYLNQQDKRIEMEMSSLDSQIKLLSGELDNVEKGENDSAKKSAPTFGLS